MMAVLREGSNTFHIMIGKKVPSAPEEPCDTKRKLYMDASVVIPTKNGGQRLASVLKAIFSQNTRYEYEVICIDSGSTDSTLDVIRSFPSCRLVQIAPEDFGHGRTRNLGASLSSGEFVIFVTQDALPASDRWLESFVDAMRLDDDIVGGFGRHLPYPDCNIIDSRNITNLFDTMGDENAVIYAEDPERYKVDPAYRQQLSFFSDNNACVRRKVFLEHPYPDIDFAEDQAWMKAMLGLGFKKVYCPGAQVYHSHNYRRKEYFMRCYDEYQALYQLFDGFLVIERWRAVPKRARDGIKADKAYVKSLGGSPWQKFRWNRFVTWRNWEFCVAGYLGGKSNTFSPEKRARFDRKFSQRLRQTKA